MHRSFLTSVFVFALAAGSCGLAAADEAPAPGAAATATTAVAAPAAAAPAAESAPTTAEAGPDDSAPPTAGADLVMWNAAPDAAMQPVAEPAPQPRMSRLRRFASGIMSKSSAIASSLTRSAMRFLGTPYVFGGTRPSGFDCSGYVQHVFAMLGVHLPRTADAQYDAAHRIASVMEPGDLVFFHTYAPGVSHVGIYLGNDKFIHSSSSHGVSIASLHSSYWAPRYLGAKRVFRQ